MSPDELLTVAQIAEILKLNDQTVRNWIDAGALPAIRIGRRVRVRWGDVEAMMKPAGPVTSGASQASSTANAQAFWTGDYTPTTAPPSGR